MKGAAIPPKVANSIANPIAAFRTVVGKSSMVKTMMAVIATTLKVLPDNATMVTAVCSPGNCGRGADQTEGYTFHGYLTKRFEYNITL